MFNIVLNLISLFLNLQIYIKYLHYSNILLKRKKIVFLQLIEKLQDEYGQDFKTIRLSILYRNINNNWFLYF